jgi:mannose-6-phosphate isomerase
MNLYPLKFTPLSKYRIWGGNKLNTILNKGFQTDNIGESWEISDVEGGKTKVCNGALTGYSLQQLAAEFKDAFVGKNVYDSFGTAFPLLIKFIDAKTPLSIQVHPNDAVAKERHASFGKNEMWYVMQGDENAELIVGFDKALNKRSYQEYLNSNNILDVMHHETVQKGDTFYIPAGRVHAIGAGVLLAEIQQTSDVTYRIFDYERVDKLTGKTRELHNDLALDIIDFEVHENYKTDYSKEKNYSNTLVHAPYFTSNYLNIEGALEKDYSGIDSFIIYICISGSLTLIENEISYSLVQGETILIPASIHKINVHAASNAELLEVYY